MTQQPKLLELAKLVMRNEAKSIELGVLLRGYATQEELKVVEGILEKCRERQNSAGKKFAGTFAEQIFNLASSMEKLG
jgi:hypothetical protein